MTEDELKHALSISKDIMRISETLDHLVDLDDVRNLVYIVEDFPMVAQAFDFKDFKATAENKLRAELDRLIEEFKGL